MAFPFSRTRSSGDRFTIRGPQEAAAAQQAARRRFQAIPHPGATDRRDRDDRIKAAWRAVRPQLAGTQPVAEPGRAEIPDRQFTTSLTRARTRPPILDQTLLTRSVVRPMRPATPTIGVGGPKLTDQAGGLSAPQ